MLYQHYETEISKQHLATVFSEMKEPVCLLGGWAVFLSVNERFNKSNGRSYIGSRDIDIGFHIDPNWSKEDLRNSTFAQSIRILRNKKFIILGSRFVKHYDIDTKREITEEESKKKQSYEMFQLYVDTITDNIHKDAHKVLGFYLLDEPLLSFVFNNNYSFLMNEFDVKFRLPNPEILVATKLKSVTNRSKDDKRTKDISDIYALLWYSKTDIGELKPRIQEILRLEKIIKIVQTFTDKDYELVSTALGIPKNNISRVINEITQ